jgi:putative metallopeptidase DUF4344
MTRILHAAAISLALTLPAFAPAAAQPAPELRNTKVKVDYLEPRDPGPSDAKAQEAYRRYLAIYERMTRRQVLEEFAAFMAPLRLPVGLRVRTQECNGQINAFYDPSEWTIKLCYEFIDNLETKATKSAEEYGFTRSEAIVGGFLMVLLHETGHAMSDIYELPVLGREEDSADQLAAFVMLQFGPEVARTAINGAAFYWMTSWTGGDWFPHFDTHSTGAQRAATFLCIAYGGNPDGFKDLVEKRWLSKERADNCAREYQQVRLAFVKTMLPSIDQELLKRVQANKWLRPDDGKW